jgi:phosphoglycerol transferase MdoB-like AlkP superfamily enzyme
MAGALCILPLLFLSLKLISNKRWLSKVFSGVLIFEIILVCLIHSGEINVYDEWNHKLTSRVFKHLSNPDEVFRTAAWTSTFWYIFFFALEVFVAWKGMRFLFKLDPLRIPKHWSIRILVSLFSFVLFGGISFVLLRGGFQQIPLNINAAIYSTNPLNNDLSINSTYNFAKSYLLYNRTDIDEFMPKMDMVVSTKIVEGLYTYPKTHNNYFLTTSKPNIVFVVLEGWSSNAMGCLSETKEATPNFDKIATEGLLFTNVRAASGTSEIGNSTIFSGFPAIPEVSITMQPEKHRKIQSINQELKKRGYISSYLFGGDLKYGNIGGYLLDHGFDKVIDENNLPNIPRGKLNYYDEDLYRFFLKEINQTKQPFLQCVFTGSSHAPYDHPKTGKQKFDGVESDYMNSLVYSDKALGKFIKEVKKLPCYKNTLFVFVADHGHGTPFNESPHVGAFFRIPLLFWGEMIKPEYKNKKINTLGSQCDIAATLLYQLGIDSKNYPWSKDLMNPNVPEFALHTINKGYGWVTNKGNMTFQMQSNIYVEDLFDKKIRKQEINKGNALLNEVYRYYKKL